MGTAALTLRLEETECRAQGVTWGRRGLASTSKCCEPELSWTSIPPPPAPLTCLSPPAPPPSAQPQAALSHCRVSLRDSGSLSQKKYRGVQNTLFYLTCITSLPGMASDPPHTHTPPHHLGQPCNSSQPRRGRDQPGTTNPLNGRTNPPDTAEQPPLSVNPTKGLSTLLVSPKNQLLFLTIFPVVFLASTLFIFALILPPSFCRLWV